MKNNFFDLDAYDDYDIVQEGTETGSLDFNFDDTNEEVTQEGMFDSGFATLRSGIANALKDTKYKVSYITRSMLGKDMFTVSDGNTTTTIESKGNGCKVVTRDGNNKMKVNFNNISLSVALRNLIDLFKSPEHILEGDIIDPGSEELVVQEADEPSDDDTVEEAIEKENTSTDEEPRTEETVEEDTKVEEETPNASDDDKHFLSYEELDEMSDKSDSLDGSTTPDGDDLKDFGTDTSDVQNDYDPKEIEILNKLIAAEGEAINDYFDASKDSHDSNARRLYSDIGHEERFHMEQLLFQKAQFTGEKYEPRDPEVKKEYEELLKMGMDDETAINTAIDKQSMMPSDDGDDSDIDAFEIDFESALTLLHQNEILMEAAQFAYDKRGNKEIFNNYSIIAEAFLYQEEVINTASVPSQVKKVNPITLLIKGLKTAVNGLLAATNAARNASEANRIKRKRKMDWIKKHGIGAIFAGGVSFYFYDDNTGTFDMTRPCQYVDMLYRLSINIGKKCGIQPKPEAYHGTIKNPIKFTTIGDGMAKIKTLQVTKTKVVVNDNNKEALANEFFGYNEHKINVKVWNEEANKAIYQSNNVYTKLEMFSLITNQYLNITLGIMEVLEKMQGDMNSIYYKNRNLYNDATNNMQIIATTYRKLINACVSDLAQMNKFDKSILASTRERDTAEQTGQKWEGEEHRTSGSMVKTNKNENQYAKQKR